MKVTATSSDSRTIEQMYTLTVTAAPVNDPDPVQDDDEPAPGDGSSDDGSDETPAPAGDDAQNDTAANDTAPGSGPSDNSGSSGPSTRTVTAWRSSWLKSFFSWFNWPLFGGSSALAKPVAMHSASSYAASSGNALDGSSEDGALAMISLAATAALAGAYVWASRKMN